MSRRVQINLLQEVDHYSYTDNVLFELEDIDSLIDAYKFNAFLIIHDALLEFIREDCFKKLNIRKDFQFYIAEHDCGEVYPLLVV